MRLSLILILSSCAPITSNAPICRAGDELQKVIAVDVPATPVAPAQKMWLCYTPNEFSSTPEMAAAGVLANMAEGHIRRGDTQGGLTLFTSAWERMPDPRRRTAIAFELAKRVTEPEEAVKWLGRAADYVDVSPMAAEEYADVADQIRMRMIGR